MLTGFSFNGSPVQVNFLYYRVFPKDICDRIKKKGHPSTKRLRLYHRGNDGGTPYPRGGKTTAFLYIGEGCGSRTLAEGSALCSMSDTFNYEEGRNRSLERAMEKLLPMIKEQYV